MHASTASQIAPIDLPLSLEHENLLDCSENEQLRLEGGEADQLAKALGQLPEEYSDDDLKCPLTDLLEQPKEVAGAPVWPAKDSMAANSPKLKPIKPTRHVGPLSMHAPDSDENTP